MKPNVQNTQNEPQGEPNDTHTNPFIQSVQPFGLTFNPFKTEIEEENPFVIEEHQGSASLAPQEQLLHELGRNAGEIAAKEGETERLRLEIQKQQKCIESQVRGHVDEMQVFLDTIQDLETLVVTKNSEIERKRDELMKLHDSLNAKGAGTKAPCNENSSLPNPQNTQAQPPPPPATHLLTTVRVHPILTYMNNCDKKNLKLSLRIMG